MKKTLCKRICAILVSCMLFVSLLPVTAMAAESIDYVALGDSISTGYGLDDTDQSFPNDVAASAALSLTNLAKDGETTQSLLEKLKDADSPEIKAVATADVITVTIGGNDFMNVLYDFIAAQYNEGKEETAQITGEEVQKILADKTSPLRITVLMAAMKNFSEFVTSPETITAMQKFQQNFSSIIATIRSVNPDVLLMVTNLYNPYAAFPEEMKEISDVFDAAIVQINKQIAAGTDSYILLDLYTGFNEMLENTEESCCNAYYNSALDFDLDFHPNDMGHSLISAMVLKEIDTPVPMFALWVNNVDMLNGGSVPGVSFDPETNTLTLENAVIDTVCEEGYGDGIYAEGDLTIVLKGENVIRGEEMDYGIDVDPGSLTIIGDGSLEVEAVDNAIYVGENLVIGGTVNIQASARGSALYAGNVIKIGEEYFFLSDTDVTIQNGVLVEQVEPLEELWVNNVDMLNGGSVPGVSFDPQTNTLTLENAVIDTPYEAENAGIYAKGDLTIVLKGENVIRGNNINFGIGVHAGNLTISGDGSLEVEAAEIAMASQYYIIINESVSLDLHGKYNAFEAGDGVFVYATSKTYAEIWEGNTSVLMEKYPGFLSDMITPVQGMWVDGIIKYSPYFRCSFHEIVSGISASPSEITFETVTPDYEQPEAETVTIKNTGNMPLILTAPTSAAYEIEMPADTTLDVGESITVAIRPKADLDIGTYDETLSFTGAINKISFFRSADSASNVAVAAINVSFAVKECYTLTFETNGGEAIDAITAFDGTVIDLADYVPTKADEVFTGWYADEALTEPVTNVTLDHSQTVYAGWKTTATEEMPDTGDNNTVAWWMMLLFAAGTAGLATAVYAKKKYSSK